MMFFGLATIITITPIYPPATNAVALPTSNGLDMMITNLKNLTAANIVTADNNKDPSAFPLPSQLGTPVLSPLALSQQHQQHEAATLKNLTKQDIFTFGSLVISNFNQYVKDGIYHILGQARNTNLINGDNLNKTFTDIRLKITLNDAEGKIIGLKDTLLPIGKLEPENNDTFDIFIKDSDVAHSVFDIKNYTISLGAKTI
jgi:hypothetical protein